MSDAEIICILIFDKSLDEVAEDILSEGNEDGTERVHTD